MSQDNFQYFNNAAGDYYFYDTSTFDIPLRLAPSDNFIYAYIPLYLSDISQISVGFVSGVASTRVNNPSARYPNPTSVDLITNGTSRSVTFETSPSYSEFNDQLGPLRYATFYPAYFTGTGNVDTIRLSYQSGNGLSFVGLRYIVCTTSNGDIQIIINLIGELDATIRELIDVLKAQGSTTVTQLIQINTYLHTITTVSDEDKLQIITIKNSYSSINETMQHYESIIDAANASINAPTASAAAGSLDRTQILPDFDASSLGAGSSDSGIGVILSNAWVIKMLVAVLGIASLSYILYGKKG